MADAKESTYRQYYSLNGMEIDEVILLGNSLSFAIAAVAGTPVPGELVYQIQGGLALLNTDKVNALMQKMKLIMDAADIKTLEIDVPRLGS